MLFLAFGEVARRTRTMLFLAFGEVARRTLRFGSLAGGEVALWLLVVGHVVLLFLRNEMSPSLFASLRDREWPRLRTLELFLSPLGSLLRVPGGGHGVFEVELDGLAAGLRRLADGLARSSSAR